MLRKWGETTVDNNRELADKIKHLTEGMEALRTSSIQVTLSSSAGDDSIAGAGPVTGDFIVIFIFFP